METKIRIGTSAIQFLSPLDSKKVVFTIWEEDYDTIILSIQNSRNMKKDYKKIIDKYEYPFKDNGGKENDKSPRKHNDWKRKMQSMS